LYAWQAKVLFAIWNSIIPFCQSVREHPYWKRANIEYLLWITPDPLRSPQLLVWWPVLSTQTFELPTGANWQHLSSKLIQSALASAVSLLRCLYFGFLWRKSWHLCMHSLEIGKNEHS
jgi:hypothetical protein